MLCVCTSCISFAPRNVQNQMKIANDNTFLEKAFRQWQKFLHAAFALWLLGGPSCQKSWINTWLNEVFSEKSVKLKCNLNFYEFNGHHVQGHVIIFVHHYDWTKEGTSYFLICNLRWENNPSFIRVTSGAYPSCHWWQGGRVTSWMSCQFITVLHRDKQHIYWPHM